jgi:hypothetical protein
VNGQKVETRPYCRAKVEPPPYVFFDARGLRRLRKKKGLSLKEADAAAGVPWQTIAHYEQGRDFKKNNRGRHPLLQRFQATCVPMASTRFRSANCCDCCRFPGTRPEFPEGLPGRGGDSPVGAAGFYEGLQPVSVRMGALKGLQLISVKIAKAITTKS